MAAKERSNIMAIVFDFHPEGADVQPVTVHSDDPAEFDRLAACADGTVPGDEIVRIRDCTPERADRGEWMFRARLIRDVRWSR